MQFGPADWPFLPNEFKCMKIVWPFIKISDWPFLRNTIDMLQKRALRVYPDNFKCRSHLATSSHIETTPENMKRFHIASFMIIKFTNTIRLLGTCWLQGLVQQKATLVSGAWLSDSDPSHSPADNATTFVFLTKPPRKWHHRLWERPQNIWLRIHKPFL